MEINFQVFALAKWGLHSSPPHVLFFSLPQQQGKNESGWQGMMDGSDIDRLHLGLLLVPPYSYHPNTKALNIQSSFFNLAVIFQFR